MGEIAIVIGATGLIGRALVDKLAEAAHIDQVITLTRSEAEHPSAKVNNKVVDFDRLEDYTSFFKGDLFFSCLGTTRKKAGSVFDQRRVDLDYQYNAAELAASQGVDHYLLVSSSGANADSNNSYLQMKGELEQRVLALPFNRISIFRPSLLLGQRSELRVGEKIAGYFLSVLCKIPWLRRFRPIHGEKVAAKMIQVSQQQGASLEIFLLDEIFL